MTTVRLYHTVQLTRARQPRTAAAVLLAAVAWAAAAAARAEAPQPGPFDHCLAASAATASEANDLRDYGPCDCRGRGTLLQWSYGTSFSGGPNLDEPLATDRPDFTEASVTVGRRVLQLESGYTYLHDRNDAGSTHTHSLPEALFRLGVLADWFELRLAQNHVNQRDNVVRDSGVDDLYLGIKLGLTPQEGILPEMALVPQMTVPTGHSDVSAGRTLGGLNWLYGWDVNNFLATGASTQFNSSVDEETDRVYTEWAQSWTVNYTLTERLGAYTEWFAFFPHGADTARTQHYFDGGFIYRFTNDVQWDIRGGVGLSDAADDYFVGTGLSIRFH